MSLPVNFAEWTEIHFLEKRDKKGPLFCGKNPWILRFYKDFRILKTGRIVKKRFFIKHNILCFSIDISTRCAIYSFMCRRRYEGVLSHIFLANKGAPECNKGA